MVKINKRGPSKPAPDDGSVENLIGFDAAARLRLASIIAEFQQLDTRVAEQSLEALKLIAEMTVLGYDTTTNKGVGMVRQPDVAIRAIQAMADVRDKMPKAPPTITVNVNLAVPGDYDQGDFG